MRRAWLAAGLLLLALLALAPPAGADIAVHDTAATKADAATTTQDLTYTVTAGADLLVVGIAWRGTATITSVTWDVGGTAQALTEAVTATNGTTIRSALYVRVAPTVGTLTLRVVFSATQDDTSVIAAITFSGVNSSDPIGSVGFDTGSGGPALVNVPSVQSGHWVVSAIAHRASTPSVGGGETLRWQADAGTVTGSGSTEANTSGATATVEMRWVSVPNAWALVAMELNAAPGAVGPPRRLLLGVGR